MSKASKERLEQAQARVTANWERFKDRFVGKTDQELRDLAKNYFETESDRGLISDGIYIANRPISRGGCFQTQVCMVTTHADLTAYFFAIEEELRVRGVGGVYDN